MQGSKKQGLTRKTAHIEESKGIKKYTETVPKTVPKI